MPLIMNYHITPGIKPEKAKKAYLQYFVLKFIYKVRQHCFYD